jgi:V-type H+-transporting ATPase subunit a
VQAKLEEIEQDLIVINENSERLKKSQAELSELQLVLEKAGAFFDEARLSAHGAGGESSASAVDAPLLDDVPVCLLCFSVLMACSSWLAD